MPEKSIFSKIECYLGKSIPRGQEAGALGNPYVLFSDIIVLRKSMTRTTLDAISNLMEAGGRIGGASCEPMLTISLMNFVHRLLAIIDIDCDDQFTMSSSRGGHWPPHFCQRWNGSQTAGKQSEAPWNLTRNLCSPAQLVQSHHSEPNFSSHIVISRYPSCGHRAHFAPPPRERFSNPKRTKLVHGHARFSNKHMSSMPSIDKPPSLLAIRPCQRTARKD